MSHENIKQLFSSAVASASSNISDHVVNPQKDFTRSKKIPADKLISFLVSEGSSSTKNEMLDFFGMHVDKPTDSALNQQRAKLKPEALEAVLCQFNASIDSLSTPPKYRFIAADGSTATFFSQSRFSSSEYFVKPGSSARGVYSIHINAFYDLDRHTYTTALLQPVHEKDEFRAFCSIVDRHPVLPGSQNVYIGDRGYCSYNNMAHVIENQQYFLFRTKDIHSKGLVGGFDFPDEKSFDITVKVTLVRNHSSKIQVKDGYRRVDKATSFDYIEYGSKDTYELSFRIVRFPISDHTYECIVTNLPRDEFPPERIKKLYYARWGIETSFRKLKYTIGLSNFHSYKPAYVKQEIWARLITYNITETLINYTVVEKKDTNKHSYKVNFSVAAHICRKFLRQTTEESPIDVTALLQKELIPIRNERQYPRLQTAHFRRPRYFIYRAA